LREALEIEDADKRKKAVGEAIKAGDKAKIEALVTLAQNHLGASPTLFDADPLLLGVLNGVVDLHRRMQAGAPRRFYDQVRKR
jgi:hypothetical protein